MADSETKKKTNFFKGVRREFKKITWPTWNDAMKQMVVVSIITLILAVIIAIVDIAFGFGIAKITEITF